MLKLDLIMFGSRGATSSKINNDTRKEELKNEIRELRQQKEKRNKFKEITI